MPFSIRASLPAPLLLPVPLQIRPQDHPILRNNRLCQPGPGPSAGISLLDRNINQLAVRTGRQFGWLAIKPRIGKFGGEVLVLFPGVCGICAWNWIYTWSWP